jgi:hypothetical protein
VSAPPTLPYDSLPALTSRPPGVTAATCILLALPATAIPALLSRPFEPQTLLLLLISIIVCTLLARGLLRRNTTARSLVCAAAAVLLFLCFISLLLLIIERVSPNPNFSTDPSTAPFVAFAGPLACFLLYALTRPAAKRFFNRTPPLPPSPAPTQP